jgi:hypothetical protein
LIEILWRCENQLTSSHAETMQRKKSAARNLLPGYD